MPECALPSIEEIEDDNDENFVNDKIPLAFTQASERAIAAHQAFRDENFVTLKHLVPDVLSKVMANRVAAPVAASGLQLHHLVHIAKRDGKEELRGRY